MTSVSNQYYFPKDASSRQDLANKFQEGDVIFYRGTGLGVERIDVGISMLQRVTHIITSLFTKRNNHANTVHVAVVVKAEGERVLIAEAMPCRGYQIRELDFLSDHSTVLSESEPYDYQVFHCKDQDMREKVSKVAQHLSRKVSYLGGKKKQQPLRYKNSFSFLKGVIGIAFSSASFKKKAKERAFLSIFDESIGASTSTGSAEKGQTFFCSNFVAHVFQQTIAYQAWETIDASVEKTKLNSLKTKFQSNQKKIKDFQRKFRIANKKNKQVTALKCKFAMYELQRKNMEIRESGIKWAKQMAKQHGNSLESGMKSFKVDAMHISPQHLHSYVENNSSLFQPAFEVIPPTV